MRPRPEFDEHHYGLLLITVPFECEEIRHTEHYTTDRRGLLFAAETFFSGLNENDSHKAFLIVDSRLWDLSDIPDGVFIPTLRDMVEIATRR